MEAQARKTLFYFQLTTIALVMIISFANIVLKTGNLVLWTSLVSSSLGYILPNPKLKSIRTPLNPVGMGQTRPVGHDVTKGAANV
jgi:hypothetical protein